MKATYIYFLTLISTLIIDFIWLGIILKSFYAKELGTLMKSPANLYSALAVYIILALGLVFFVSNNTLATSYLSFALLGALFGFIVYAVFDFTNFAVLQGYSLKIVIVDILWGTTLGATLGLLTKFFINI